MKRTIREEAHQGSQVLTAALGLFRIAGHILQAFRLICREGSRVIMALRVQGVLKRVPIIAPPPWRTFHPSTSPFAHPSARSFLFRFNGNAEAKLAVFIH